MSEKKNRVAGKSGLKRFFSSHASEISIGSALLIICIVLSICSPYFLQIRNFKNILSYVSIAGVMSAGLTVVMLMGCMDLSQYAAMAIASGQVNTVAVVYSNVDPAREWNGATTVEFNEPNEPQTQTCLSGSDATSHDVYAIVRAATYSEAEEFKALLRDVCEEIAASLTSENTIYAWAIAESGVTADARGIVEGESFYGYVHITLTERNEYVG